MKTLSILFMALISINLFAHEALEKYKPLNQIMAEEELREVQDQIDGVTKRLMYYGLEYRMLEPAHVKREREMSALRDTGLISSVTIAAVAVIPARFRLARIITGVAGVSAWSVDMSFAGKTITSGDSNPDAWSGLYYEVLKSKYKGLHAKIQKMSPSEVEARIKRLEEILSRTGEELNELTAKKKELKDEIYSYQN